MTGDATPLRVALLHGFDPAEVRRGTERLVEELSAGLREGGDEVTLITAHSGRRREEVRDGVRVVLNRRPPARGPLARHALAHTPASWRALRRGTFDVANAFHPSDALAAVAWGRKRGAPVVLTVPAFPPVGPGRLRRGLLRRAFSGAACVVVPTQAVAAAVAAAHPGARTTVIAPGVDVERFTPGPARAETPTVFCAADPAEPRKRVELLVRAMGGVRAALPAARLVVADPYRGQRSQPPWLRAEGIEVRPIGGDDDLRAAYREAWVTALPAHDEPFGLVLTESMACGTPVLGAEHGGIPEVIGHGPQGALVAGGAEAWSVALSDALGSPPGEDDARAARRRAEEFSLRRCVDEYAALYRRLVRLPA